jgi:ABC-type lipoprotein release transport system permease subunit
MMPFDSARLWAGADICRRRSALVVLAALIALPVGCALALVAGSHQAGTSVERFIESTQLADVVAFTDGDPGADVLERIAADERIASVGRSDPVVIVAGAMEPGERAFALVGTDDAPAGGFGTPMLLSGRYPAADATDEIVVNERAAQEYGLEVGTRTPLTGLVSMASFETRSLGDATVVGGVRTPFDLVDDPTTEHLVLAGPAFLDGRWTELARPGTILWLRLHDRTDVAAVVSDLSQIVSGDVRAGTDLLSTAQRAADLQRRGLLVAAAVVGAVGLLLTAQAVARHLAGRSEDNLVLTAIGFTRGERRIAALLSIAPGLIGGIASGFAVAVGLSALLPLGLPRRADPDLGIHVGFDLVVLSIVAALLVTMAAAVAIERWLTPARRHVDERLSPVARVVATLGLRPVPLTGCRLAVDGGQGRRRLPAAATLATLVATTGVAVAALVVAASLDGLVADPERYGQPWDTFVVSIGTDELAAVGRQLSSDPRIAAVDIAREGELDVTAADGAVTQVATAGVDGTVGPPSVAALDGRTPSTDAEIALASRTMSQLGLRIGDTTIVGGACGKRSMTVVGRAVAPIMLGGDPDHGSIITGATFEQLCADRLIAEVDRNHGALIRFADPSSAEAVLDDLFPDGYYAEPVMVPSSITALEQIATVPRLVAALVAILGIAAAANTLVLAVRRRAGDVAVLRSLGLRPSDVRHIFGWQALTMAAITTAFGIPAGVVVGRLVWTGIASPANVRILVEVAPLRLAVVAVAVVVNLLVVAIWPGRRAARLRPAELLRSE